MTRIRTGPRVEDAKTYVLTDPDRRCSCGRTPEAFFYITNFELLANDEQGRHTLLRVRYGLARKVLDTLPPCDHGAVERARHRHLRRRRLIVVGSV